MKPTYLTPRLAIATIFNYGDVGELTRKVEARHMVDTILTLT